MNTSQAKEERDGKVKSKDRRKPKGKNGMGTEEKGTKGSEEYIIKDVKGREKKVRNGMQGRE